MKTMTTGKRTYTVPILLILLTLMAILIVVLFSRLLLDNQSLKTERGHRLAERYASCQSYANALEEYASGMLSAKDEGSRMAAQALQGGLGPTGDECRGLLYEAGIRAGASKEEALNGAAQPIAAIREKLDPIGKQGGEPAAADRKTLETIHGGAVELQQTLQSYAVPTGDQRYRQMQAGVEWLPVARQALNQLQQLAAGLE